MALVAKGLSDNQITLGVARGKHDYVQSNSKKEKLLHKSLKAKEQCQVLIIRSGCYH